MLPAKKRENDAVPYARKSRVNEAPRKMKVLEIDSHVKRKS